MCVLTGRDSKSTGKIRDKEKKKKKELRKRKVKDRLLIIEYISFTARTIE